MADLNEEPDLVESLLICDRDRASCPPSRREACTTVGGQHGRRLDSLLRFPHRDCDALAPLSNLRRCRPRNDRRARGVRGQLKRAVHAIVSITPAISALSIILSAAGVLGVSRLTTPPAQADDNPVLHHVQYTVTASSAIYTQLYYLDREPAVFADWSHNPYEFAPNVQADLAPGKPWTYELWLARPDMWAFVSASAGTEPGRPVYHCELSIDGAVVASKDGERGVLCSIRIWGTA